MEQRSFELGVGMVNSGPTGDQANTSYYRSDHLGTTRRMSNANGNMTASLAYTAFGEVVSATATTTFGYDARSRLTSEVRTGPNAYNLAYQYDHGGNRTKKIETRGLNDRTEWWYYYDYENPSYYGSHNNRLKIVEEKETAMPQQSSMTGGGEFESMSGSEFESLSSIEPEGGGTMLLAGGQLYLVSTSWYYYTEEGNVRRVVTHDENEPLVYTAKRFGLLPES